MQVDGPDPFFLEYLALGQLAHVHGSTLFVHGAVTELNMGTVPGEDRRHDTVQGWVKALNDWCRDQV
eukprot:6899711-Pyramimonas_sp.AAC.1